MSKMMNSRVFVGNLAAEKVTRQEVEQLFSEYGKVLGVSLHKSYGFVQFAEEECAKSSVKGLNGHSLHDLRLGELFSDVLLWWALIRNGYRRSLCMNVQAFI